MEPERLYSREAEAAVLGSMLIDPVCIPRVLDHVFEADAFFFPEHKILFDALCLLQISGTGIDVVTLRSKLKADGTLAKVGDAVDPLCGQPEWAGAKYVEDIAKHVPPPINAEYYAEEVRKFHEFRKLIAVSEQIQAILDSYDPVDEKSAQIYELIVGAKVETKRAYGPVDGYSVIEALDGGEVIFETGFADIDKKVAFAPGDLVYIAGRPSMGKTALCLNIAEQMANYRGILVISLEMPKSRIERRLCARRARVNWRFRNADGEQALREAAQELKGLPIYVSDHVEHLGQILALATRAKQEYGVQVLMIDYLQLLYAQGKKIENRNQELAVISRELKRLAIRENLLVIVASQLNRQPDSRADKRPQLSDLRDSGGPEQDADWVLFVYRADYYRPPTEDKDGLATVIVAKARDGETGDVDMVFTKELASFENLYKGDIT